MNTKELIDNLFEGQKNGTFKRGQAVVVRGQPGKVVEGAGLQFDPRRHVPVQIGRRVRLYRKSEVSMPEARLEAMDRLPKLVDIKRRTQTDSWQDYAKKARNQLLGIKVYPSVIP